MRLRDPETMPSWLEENLCCVVCQDIFQQPVLLTCGHSFCKSCLHRWWIQKTSPECPLCKKISFQRDPPLNVALKNLSEAYSLEKSDRASAAGLCSQHSESLGFFCVDHQQPVCAACLHSETHSNHSIRPVDEAARQHRQVLQELLKSSQEKLELFSDIERNFDQTARDVQVQAEETEKQMKDVFLMLQKLLKMEELVRISAVRQESRQKIQMMKRKSEALSRDVAALSDWVKVTEEQLRAEDLSVLQGCRLAAQTAQHPLPDVTLLLQGALIDTDKHLNNLSSKVLYNMKMKVTSCQAPRTAESSLRGANCPGCYRETRPLGVNAD